MGYIQNTDDDRREMLQAIGVSAFDELLEPIDAGLRLQGGLSLGNRMSEAEVIARCSDLADKNRPASGMVSFLGGGIYDRYIPTVVNYVLSRSEFYTSYTPYQAEASQGTLQAIYEYQTLICRLTAMDIANASMYDGATALAEAALMAYGITRKQRILIPRAISPNAKAVLDLYMQGRDIAVEEVPFTDEGIMDLDHLRRELTNDVAGVIVAQPNYFGMIEPAESVSALAHENGSLLIASVDPVSCAVLAPPGEYEADIAVGEGQSLGNPQNFGGPLLGFMATRKEYVRKCPGRLISSTVDVEGARGYVMTLQTREQHIRREKATSNICTNEGLCALAAAVYMVSLGEEGFREVAMQSLSKSHTLYSMLRGLEGVRLPFGEGFFQEFVLDAGGPAADFLAAAKERGILAGIPLHGGFPELGEGAVLAAVTEKRTREELEAYRDIARVQGGGAGE